MMSETKKRKSLYGDRGGTAGNVSIVPSTTPFPVSIPNTLSLWSGSDFSHDLSFSSTLLLFFLLLPAQLLSSAHNKVHKLNLNFSTSV
jgi:hypothetical protein